MERSKRMLNKDKLDYFEIRLVPRPPKGKSLKDCQANLDSLSSQTHVLPMRQCNILHKSVFDISFFFSSKVCNDENDDHVWHHRVRGLRPNSSELSHEELDSCESLDEGNPDELGRLVSDLRSRHFSHLNVFGGCCGTNVEHVKAIAGHIKASLDN
jgi:hypothetical protein